MYLRINVVTSIFNVSVAGLRNVSVLFWSPNGTNALWVVCKGEC